jgi:lipid-A-disaccharide synthase
MLSCGEASGDLYAAALTHAIKARSPETEVVGLGGPRLAAAGATLDATYDGLTVTGLVEALPVLLRAARLVKTLVTSARDRRPDVFVAVDSPDFNFWLLAKMRALGIPVVYYISPQLWAWRASRLKTIRQYVDRMLVIFPFETAMYEQAGVPVEFVGHPLIDLIPPATPRAVFLRSQGLDPASPVVALLPGSRPSEVGHVLPTLARSVIEIRRSVPSAQFIVARAAGLADAAFAPLDEVRASGTPLAIVEHATDDVIASSDTVITASGTATVQTALHDRPMVIVYRLSPLTYAIGRHLVRVSTYGMVNLVAGRRIVPELIQDEFTPARVASETTALLLDASKADAMRADLGEMVKKLGGSGATGRAADAVLAVARAR